MKKYKIESILFTTDFSKSGQSALKTSAAICKRQKSKLSLIHVVDKSTLISPSESSNAGKISAENFLAQALQKLEAISLKMSQENQIETNSIVEKGSPAEVICKVASEGMFSLIVMGIDGNSGIREMGSVVYNVVKNAPCPVLVVPDNWDHNKFSKIVYPIRMNQKVFEKYNYIEPIIEKNNSELIIAGLAEKDESEHIKGAVFSIDLLRNMCQDENIPFSTLILPCNDFATKLINTSDDVNANLIVISAHLNYDSKENSIDHFAISIINLTKCPVLSISPLIIKQTD